MTSASGGGEFEQFRQTFFEECSELLAELDGQLGVMKRGEADNEALNAIFRAVHSIKAGAGAFGFRQLVEFAHRFEAVLDNLREGKLSENPRLVAILVQSSDVLASLVEAAQGGQETGADFGADVIADLDALLESKPAGSKPAMPVAALPVTARRVRIDFEPMPDLFRHANEPLLLLRELRQLGACVVTCDAARLPLPETMEPDGAYLGWTIELTTAESHARIAEVFEFVQDDCRLVIEDMASAGMIPLLAEAAALPASANASASASANGSANGPANGPEGAERPNVPEPVERARTSGAEPAKASASIRVDLARIDRLVNMVGELVITQSMLAQQISELALKSGGTAPRGQEDLALLTRELQDCVMAIRMQPVKSVFSRMPRLVREVASKLGKSVRLVMSGEQTEVDKTVIEELSDPLTHMIRNAIDHGIESAAERRANGKPEEGTIELSALHAGSNILIHITDDGAGVNRDRLIAKAVSKGIIPPNTVLSEEEVYELLFAPGFSTAEKVTDVSGRGVGMDVVRRNIVNLGGRIQVQSIPGKGTRFTLIIPLTLAVLDGMIIAVGSERYILPLTSIIESYRPERHSIRSMAGGMQVAAIRGEYIRLVYLHELFGRPGTATPPNEGLVVLVETAQGAKIGVVVDELIGQQQVVIKSLLGNFEPVQGISGATILGNGRVALILDIEELSRMGRPVSAPPQTQAPLIAAA